MYYSLFCKLYEDDEWVCVVELMTTLFLYSWTRIHDHGTTIVNHWSANVLLLTISIFVECLEKDFNINSVCSL